MRLLRCGSSGEGRGRIRKLRFSRVGRQPRPALLGDPAALDAFVSDGSVVATGDLEALRRLLRAVTGPSPAG